MKDNLFPFQKKALSELRMFTAEALGGYHRTHVPQVVSFTAPTGAGKTIIMASLIEDIMFGSDQYPDQPNAVFVWLSDSPQLNEQSRMKIDAKADRIRVSQTKTVTEDSFDQEIFDDGYIYFLNTQKLSKTSNLTKSGDRNYTIWETLANTAREKSDRFYVIIDEAHRGMQGTAAGKQTTIMQKFIKGSEDDHLPPMPVVIGMSATTERFNKLVEGASSSTMHKVTVTPDDVRSSGLLKDRIVIIYPEESNINKDMAVLQAAADDWREKWDHWSQYCQEQHYAYVNPVFVVQVLNGNSEKVSETDLDDCLQKIEERTGFRFDAGQVVHTFGDRNSSISINGLDVRYEEPSRIADDKNIRVVFFKESLSTGWDCPRAETMMSFRRATDATYIAQLLGRMVRTPMQSHIQVDDILNDVHLYLPHFDEGTVGKVVEALQSEEGGEIPTDIRGEQLGKKKYDTLTVKSQAQRLVAYARRLAQMPGQISFGESGLNIPVPVENDTSMPENPMAAASMRTSGVTGNSVSNTEEQNISVQSTDETQENPVNVVPTQTVTNEGGAAHTAQPSQTVETVQNIPEAPQIPEDLFDREAVMKFINDAGLLSYDVRKVVISNYLTSMFKMVRLLNMSNLYPEAVSDVNADIIKMIEDYVGNLKAAGKYDDLVMQVKQFKLSTQTFDVFGEKATGYYQTDIFSTTDTDIDRQFRLADVKLGNEGIGNEYGKKHYDPANPFVFKLDVILFAADDTSLNRLHQYAEQKFHDLNDNYRRYIARIDSDRIRRQYDSIVSDGDRVSKHNFRLPETIQIPHDADGKEYSNHLFVSEETGTAKLKLNTWEAGVIEEEEKRTDFVCWIRNPARGSWALCIPYESDNEMKPTYPDFIIVRKDTILGYVIDILEPHNPDFDDNLGKAKGFAEYARQNTGIGRIQLIRKEKDHITGKDKFRRLDMSKGAIRDKVSQCINSDQLKLIFDNDGFYD